MSKLLDNLNEIEMQKASFIIPKNLKKNVSALGVTGTLEYLDTSDATAQAKDIKEGQTAYINDQKVTGNLQYEPSDFSLNGVTGDPVSTELKTSGNNKYIQLKYKRSGADTIVGGSANVTANLQQETMAVAANITADKIKKDEVILGVTGNYEGITDITELDDYKICNTLAATILGEGASDYATWLYTCTADNCDYTTMARGLYKSIPPFRACGGANYHSHFWFITLKSGEYKAYSYNNNPSVPNDGYLYMTGRTVSYNRFRALDYFSYDGTQWVQGTYSWNTYTLVEGEEIVASSVPIYTDSNKSGIYFWVGSV